jgi:homogentisate 1,2-dioxygenase
VPVVRRGNIPRPPHGVDEHQDVIYTQKGFFGDWVHVFRKKNLGMPTAWSDDDLVWGGADTGALTPTDLADASGEPLLLLHGDGVRVLYSRRSQPMPFAEKNGDYHQIRFYHRGEFTLETELGSLEAGPGDFVVVGKGLIYRERPRTSDNVVVIFESEEPIILAEEMWNSVGFASMFIDYSGMGLPDPDVDGDPGSHTHVRVWSEGRWHTIRYDFDPCSGVVGWIGDPVIYRLNVEDVPGIGTARGFLPPPAHAVLLTESKSWFFNVLGVPPSPTQPAPLGSFGAPAHNNDYDEVWFNHASQFLPHNLGHMWLFPRTIPHPGFKRPPSHPPNPVTKYHEIKINFDTRSKLHWTDEAKAAFLEGDVRTNVFLSLYGVPPERLPGRLKEGS